MILGVLGGSGLYDIDGLDDARERRRLDAVRRPVGAARQRPARRGAPALSPAPRPRPPLLAVGDQLPRQRLRAEAARRQARALGLGGRLAARGDAAGRLRARRPVHRQDLPARLDLLRRRRGRPRRLRRADLRARFGAAVAAAARGDRLRRGGAPRRGGPARARRAAASACTAAAPTSAWRGRSSRRAPSRSCTAAGAPTSSA